MARSASDRRLKLRERLARRSADVCLLLTGLGLAAACGALEVLGPRPAVAIDALWVNDHRPQVETMLSGLLLAIGMSVPGMLSRRTRPYIVFMWIGAGVLLAARYWERFTIVMEVVQKHAL